MFAFSRYVFLAVFFSLTSCAITPEPIVKGVIEKSPDKLDAQESSLYSAKVVDKNLPENIWSFEEKGIAIRFISDKRLNMFEGSAHTLYVAIFQISNPSKFNTISSTKSGIVELLSGEIEDESILATENIVIQPSSDKVYVLDRAEQAKYLAIVTGYSELDSASSVRLIPFNAMQEPRKNLLSFFGEPEMRAAIVKLWVSLGENRIKSVELRSQ